MPLAIFWFKPPLVLAKCFISNIFWPKSEHACFKVIHSLAGGRPEGVSPPQSTWEDQRGWENVRLSQFHSFCWHEINIPNQKGCKPNQNWHQNDWKMVAVIQHNSSMAIKSTTKTIWIPNKKTIIWRWTKEYLTVLVRFNWCFLNLFTIAGVGTNLLISFQNAFSASLIHFRGQLGFSAYNAFLACTSHIKINLK